LSLEWTRRRGYVRVFDEHSRTLGDYPYTPPLAPYSYLIFEKAGIFYAKNGITEELEFPDEDAAKVIQSAVDALGVEGGKIIIKDAVDITKDILIDDFDANFIFEAQKTLRLTGGSIKIGSTAEVGKCYFYIHKLDGVDKARHGIILNWGRFNRFDIMHLINCDYGIHIKPTAENCGDNLWLLSLVEFCNYGIVVEGDPTVAKYHAEGNTIIANFIANHTNYGVWLKSNCKYTKVIANLDFSGIDFVTDVEDCQLLSGFCATEGGTKLDQSIIQRMNTKEFRFYNILMRREGDVFLFRDPNRSDYWFFRYNPTTGLITCYGGTTPPTGIGMFDLRQTKRGIANFIGDGTTTVFNIPHGLATTPTFYTAEPLTNAARADHLLSADTTNIIVTFDVAPASGASIQFSWKAEV